jgi:hypothetical protein
MALPPCSEWMPPPQTENHHNSYTIGIGLLENHNKNFCLKSSKNVKICLYYSFFFLLPASCEKNEGLGTGYNPM